MKEDKATHVLENEFPLIPMNDIDDMAREMAVSWMECEDKDWIGQKHKLASDIMNYHRIKSTTQQEYIKSLEQILSDVDLDLAGMEDYLYGEDGRKITTIRKHIQQSYKAKQALNK